MGDEPKHPQFEAFKAERLKDPEVKAAYDEAKVRSDAEKAIAGLLAEHGWEWTDGFRELVADTIYPYRGKRHCRTCQKIAAQKYRERLRRDRDS